MYISDNAAEQQQQPARARSVNVTDRRAAKLDGRRTGVARQSLIAAEQIHRLGDGTARRA